MLGMELMNVFKRRLTSILESFKVQSFFENLRFNFQTKPFHDHHIEGNFPISIVSCGYNSFKFYHNHCVSQTPNDHPQPQISIFQVHVDNDFRERVRVQCSTVRLFSSTGYYVAKEIELAQNMNIKHLLWHYSDFSSTRKFTDLEPTLSADLNNVEM